MSLAAEGGGVEVIGSRGGGVARARARDTKEGYVKGRARVTGLSKARSESDDGAYQPALQAGVVMCTTSYTASIKMDWACECSLLLSGLEARQRR